MKLTNLTDESLTVRENNGNKVVLNPHESKEVSDPSNLNELRSKVRVGQNLNEVCSSVGRTCLNG